MTTPDTIRQWALSKAGCPYIFAASGQKCTPAFRQRQMASKKDYAANIQKYCPVLSGKKADCAGCPYRDKPAYDCSGLVKAAAKLVGIALPHGASSQWKGDYWDIKGTIDQLPPDKVCFVFNAMDSGDPMGHVGIYLGDGFVIDARGHAQGVLHTRLSSYSWDHFAVLRDGTEGEVDKVSYLAVSMRGREVESLQTMLGDAGFDCGPADGIFGPKTESAVKALQAYAGLPLTGIVDEITRKALENALDNFAPGDMKALAQAVYAAIKDYL